MIAKFDEKTGILTIQVKFDAKGRNGNGEKWKKVNASETEVHDINGKSTRLQVTAFTKE